MKSSKARILFTEDHQDTCEMVKLMLEQFDYEVTTASDMIETLRLVNSRDFNLFIFDSWLPDGSGIDLCRKIRESNRRTPILFYSGLAYQKDKDLAFSSGAQAYLVKPVDQPQFLQTITELLSLEKSGLDLSGPRADNPMVQLRSATATKRL
jgi:DNA-binding response OmpR family regulator